MKPNPIETFLERLKASKNYSGQIEFDQLIPIRQAISRHFPDDLPEELRQHLRDNGIYSLYSHQAEAWEATGRGDDIVIVTGTASGKTYCYNLRVAQTILQHKNARALYLFPTKALAQDQLGKLLGFEFDGRIRAATYDGDTPKAQRGAIRRTATIVLTNPDMLHLGILPNFEQWLDFLRNLRYVVVDELHAYRGVFGSHVGNVLRRLFRLCDGLGVEPPRVICCSATIGNPSELARNLTGRECDVIAEDGSPRIARRFLIWNPAPVGEEGERRSANIEASELLAGLISADIRTIAFVRARVTAELLLRYVRGVLAEKDPDKVDRVESYRGGYTPSERRDIERRLFGGELTAVTATNALELGIDVGGLDATIINGYPGSISSVWQQAGRAGRSIGDEEDEDLALALYIAHNNPLEQHLARNPELLLDARHEHALANPQNPQILAQQLRCAAFEKPLSPADLDWFGDTARELVREMEDAGTLALRQGRYFTPGHESPAPEIDIRSAGGMRFDLLEADTYQRLGTVEEDRAFQTAHPGATYLHRGRQYLIESLDVAACAAVARATEVDFHTEATTDTSIDIQITIEEVPAGAAKLCFGGLTVTQQVTGFSRRALLTEEFLGYEYLDLPARSFDTLGVWLAFPSTEGKTEEELNAFGCAVHAAEHALVTALPVLAGCDPGDIGTSWYLGHHQTLGPVVFLFDAVPGGVGICESAFQRASEWILEARQALRGCPCEEGCPACLLTARCSARNEYLSKKGGLDLLLALQPVPEEMRSVKS